MKLNPFLEPTGCKLKKGKKDTKLVVNENYYKRKIEGLNKKFWNVVYEMGSYEEVAKMDIDTLLEAYAALEIMTDEIKEG